MCVLPFKVTLNFVEYKSFYRKHSFKKGTGGANMQLDAVWIYECVYKLVQVTQSDENI